MWMMLRMGYGPERRELSCSDCSHNPQCAGRTGRIILIVVHQMQDEYGWKGLELRDHHEQLSADLYIVYPLCYKYQGTLVQSSSLVL